MEEVILKVKRIREINDTTLGELYFNDSFECFTLEDKIREDKIYGQTAIPEGKYEMKIYPSPRFKMDLPLLLNVNNFKGILIHAGNTKEDTHGCILVGKSVDNDKLLHSKAALYTLLEKLKPLSRKNKLFIEIINEIVDESKKELTTPMENVQVEINTTKIEDSVKVETKKNFITIINNFLKWILKLLYKN